MELIAAIFCKISVIMSSLIRLRSAATGSFESARHKPSSSSPCPRIFQLELFRRGWWHHSLQSAYRYTPVGRSPVGRGAGEARQITSSKSVRSVRLIAWPRRESQVLDFCTRPFKNRQLSWFCFQQHLQRPTVCGGIWVRNRHGAIPTGTPRESQPAGHRATLDRRPPYKSGCFDEVARLEEIADNA